MGKYRQPERVGMGRETTAINVGGAGPPKVAGAWDDREPRRSRGRGFGKGVEPPPAPSDPWTSVCPTVKHPPVEPSRFMSAPTKTPDKMGFDEVGQDDPSGRAGSRGRV